MNLVGHNALLNLFIHLFQTLNSSLYFFYIVMVVEEPNFSLGLTQEFPEVGVGRR